MSLGIYISYPFCAQKCTYCNFASGVFSAELQQDYIECLQWEILSHDWACPPDTVYLGGGTPSQIPGGLLKALLARIPGNPWLEATLEAAPGTVTENQCRAWTDAGINRVSLGVQSFVHRELTRTGRKHTAQIVADEVSLLRRCGICNINIDLIAGLPGQNPASWRESLEWIERLEAPHVSVYMLEVDEDSRLGQEILLNGIRYGAPDTPGDDTIADFYESAVEYLKSLGINRYEISNFARPGFESLHNLKYWRLEPYVGFGADAHSFDGKTRGQNVEGVAEYVQHLRQGRSPRLVSAAANPAEERFYVGLRLAEGIQPQADDWHRWGARIQRLVIDGLIQTDGVRLRLTDRGVMLSNEVFQEFVNA